jgi:uncharacterized delta-60 repeat protein
MARSRTGSGIVQLRNHWGWRRANRLARATRGVLEPLERRVLLSSISIVVQGSGDDSGTITPTFNDSSDTYAANTLRDAIVFADGQTTSSSVITFATGVGSTITLTNSFSTNVGPLILNNSDGQTITINGGSRTVKGDVSSVFAITEGTATFGGLTVAHGSTNSNGTFTYSNSGSGSIHFGDNGGGIYNLANLTLSACAVNSNSATGSGGGIFTSGELNITKSLVSSNGAEGNGGGIAVSGGQVTINSSTIGTQTTTQTTLSSASNQATDGAGIYASGGTVTLSGDSNVDGNYGDSVGGGIYVKSGATLTLSGSNVNNNVGELKGGGLYSSGNVTIIGGSVSNDSVTAESIDDSGDGGGIYTKGTTEIENDCTIAGDSAYKNGGGIAVLGGNDSIYGSSVNTDIALDGGGIYANNATVLLGGDSIVSNTALESSTNTGDGGGIYGAASSTVTLQAYDSVFCSVDENSAKDSGGGIYSGGTLIITGGLVYTNSATGDGGGIFVSASGTAMFTGIQVYSNAAINNGGGIYSAGDDTITGESQIGIAPTGTQTFSNTAKNGGGVFVGGGNVSIKGDSVVDGNTASADGGGIYNSGGLSVTGGLIGTNSATGDGGGIFNSSTGDITTIDQCDINGDGAGSDGGGIYNQSGGTISMISGSTGSPPTLAQINGNTAGAGGGIFNRGQIGTLLYVSVSQDTATTVGGSIGEGGGIYNAGWIIDSTHGSATPTATGSITNITDCIINGDMADESVQEGGSGGGGIFNGSDATISMISSDGSMSLSQINDDHALAQGGGIYNAGQITIENTEIGTLGMSDTAEYIGGGILDKLHTLVPQTTTELIDCQIDGDSAEQKGGGIFNYGQFITISFCNINGDYCSGVSNPNGYRGGGLYSGVSVAGDPGTVIIDNSNLGGNYVAPGGGSEGGAIFNTLSTVTLGQDTINGSGPDSLNALQGGGIFNYQGSLGITGTLITSCTADFGGAVGIDGGTVSISGSTLTLSTANTYGGGICIFGNSLGTLHLSSSNVSANTAADSGGGIFVSNAVAMSPSPNTVYMTLDVVSSNTATFGNGGGIASGGSLLQICSSSIYSNVANDSIGGGIFTYSATTFLGDDNIYGDSALSGGGVALAGGVATISFCTIGTNTPGSFSNTATNGGGLFEDDGDGALIEGDTSIEGNQATDGGGIFSEQSLTVGYMMLSASHVNCNTASSAGGGIYVATSGEDSLLGGSISHDSVTGSGGEGAGIFSDGNVTLSGTSVTHDSLIGGSGDGGGIYLEGGSAMFGLAIVNNNTAPDDGGGIYTGALGDDTISGGTISGDSAANGGGIFTVYTTNIYNDCIISGDSATEDGGGIYGGTQDGNAANIRVVNSLVGTDGSGSPDTATNGGGIFLANGAKIDEISYSHIDGDTATGDGAGIYSAGTINGITYSTVSYNTASDSGGGIFLASNSSGAIVRYSTIAGDDAEGDGGGILDDGGNGPLKAFSSTVAYNICTSGNGGGVRVDSGAPTPEFQDCTISKNTANNGGGLSLGSGGDSVNLNNTIVSGNTATGSGNSSDVSGMDEAESQDAGNLVGNTSGSLGVMWDSSSNYFTTSPDLGTLGFYGGPTSTFFGSPTPTMLPGTSSLAVGNADEAALTNFDQRQFPWPASAPTIGAVEVTGGTILEVNTNGDPSGASANGTLSLRQAVSEAYTMSSTPVSIYFDPTVFNLDMSTSIALTQNSGTLLVQGSNTTIVMPVDGLTLVGVVENTGTLMITQANTDGTLSVTQITGSGDLILGNTLGPAGLVLASTIALVNTQTSLTIGAASTVDLGGNDLSIAGLSGSGTIGNSSTSSNSTLTLTGGTETFSGVLQDTLGSGTESLSLTITNGSLVLAGTSNTFSGPTDLNGGVLSIASQANLSPNSSIVFNGGTLQATDSFTLNYMTTIDSGGGTYDVTSGSLSVENNIVGSGGLAIEGSGIVILSGSNSFAHTTVGSVSHLIISEAGALPSGEPLTNNGYVTLQAASTASSVSGIGMLAVVGTATFTDTGSFAQNFLTNGGLTTLEGTSTLAEVNGTGTLTITGTGTFSDSVSFTQSNLVNNGSVTLLGTSTTGSISGTGLLVVMNTGGTLTDSGTFAQSNFVNSGSATLLGTSTAGSISGTGTLVVGSTGTLTDLGSFAQLSLTNNGSIVLEGTSTVGFVNGNGTLTVTGSLTDGGTFAQNSLANSGSTILKGASTVSAVNGTGTLVVTSTGTLTDSGSFAQNLLTNNGSTTLEGTSTLSLVNGSGTLTITSTFTDSGSFGQDVLTNTGSVTLLGTSTASVISGTGSLTVGNGTTSTTLTLTGANVANTQGSLTINNNSSLDIGQAALAISDGGNADSAEAAIQQYIKNGAATSTTAGSIVSSFVNANPTYGIAYADTSDSGYAGSDTLPGNVVIESDLLGDADLSGTVAFHDLQNLLGDFGNAGFWDQGNFNNHATVDFNDLQLLLGNFNGSTSLSYSDMSDIEDLVGEFGYVALPNSNGIGFDLVTCVATTINSFGTSGFAMTNITPDFDDYGIQDGTMGNAELTLSNGNIVVAGVTGNQEWADQGWGEQEILVAEFEPNGALDTSFGTDGFVMLNLGDGTNQAALSEAQLSNGDIVITGDGADPALGAGYYDVLVAELTSDGSLNTTFGTGGVVMTSINPPSWPGTSGGGAAVNVLSNGNILVAGNDGYSNMVLVEYDSTGNLDTLFGSGGIVDTDLGGGGNAVQVLSNNDIVVAGSATYDEHQSALLAEYTSAGLLNTSFGTDGLVFTSMGSYASWNAIDILASGDILACGYGNGEGALAEFTSAGNLDSSFANGAGIVGFSAGANSLVVLPNNDILIGGAGMNSDDNSAMALLEFSSTGVQEGSTQLFTVGAGAGINSTTILASGGVLIVGYGTDSSGNQQVVLGELNVS